MTRTRAGSNDGVAEASLESTVTSVPAWPTITERKGGGSTASPTAGRSRMSRRAPSAAHVVVRPSASTAVVDAVSPMVSGGEAVRRRGADRPGRSPCCRGRARWRRRSGRAPAPGRSRSGSTPWSTWSTTSDSGVSSTAPTGLSSRLPTRAVAAAGGLPPAMVATLELQARSRTRPGMSGSSPSQFSSVEPSVPSASLTLASVIPTGDSGLAMPAPLAVADGAEATSVADWPAVRP